MNTALCFYGQPRFYDITFHNYYKSILEQYNPDVFVHTWWGESMVNTIYPCGNHVVKENALSENDLLIKDDIIDNIIKLYNPKKIQYDTYDDVNIKQHKSNYYQYYTQYAVKELLTQYEIENDIEYDLVIRTRFDLMIEQPIPYQTDENMWVSGCCPYEDRYNDMFTFSNSKNYKKISDVYLNLEEFEKKNKGEMEWAFVSQIIKENISIKSFDADYSTFDILRTKSANKFR